MPSIYPQQPIPIEALSEYDVREISLDGHEILEKPLTPAENFQRVVNQIDFSEPDDDDESATRSKALDVNFKRTMPPKLWEAMKETMRTTLIEINALVDILAVIKDGKYLTINPIASEPPESNVPFFLAGKKRALSAAADILIKGTDRLRRRHTEIYDARMKISNSGPSILSETSCPGSFHKALMLLRQEWRLKLHQSSILGDVSLRSIGSHFQESGNFEIRESDLFADQKTVIDSNDAENTDIISGVEVIFSRSTEAFLNTAVGSGILKVQFHESALDSGPTTLWNSVFNTKWGKITTLDNKKHTNLTQRQRLFKAQRVLACREILFLLACEACGSRGHDSILKDSIAFATQDEIIATLFPGVQICISMATKPPNCAGDEFINVEPISDTNRMESDSFEYLNCLGLQLHRILTAQHRYTWPNLASIPQPVCGPVQVPFYHRAGGANALLASCFAPSINDSSNNLAFSIAVAGVAGFAAAAAATWYATYTNKSGFERTDASHSAQRLQPNFISQDRLSLFTEWGSLQTSGFRPTSSIDDSVPGTSGVAMMEHTLFSRGADDGALKCVVGSHPTMFNRTVSMCRHYYLRLKTHLILSEFAKFSPVKIIIRWDVLNSAFSTSTTLCFYSMDYDAYCYWLRLTINLTGITVNYPDPPRTYCLGTDFHKLKEILANQVVHTQIQFIDELATKILGWTRLGSNPLSGMINVDEVGDGPMIVKLYASPSAKHMICIRASVSLGIRLFVNDTVSEDYEHGSFCGHQNFREVKLTSVHGKHVVAKIEAIMTLLT